MKLRVVLNGLCEMLALVILPDIKRFNHELPCDRCDSSPALDCSRPVGYVTFQQYVLTGGLSDVPPVPTVRARIWDRRALHPLDYTISDLLVLGLCRSGSNNAIKHLVAGRFSVSVS